jgi:hypothetical protein
MTSPFSFQGQMGRLSYALWALGLFFSQHLVALAVIKTYGTPLSPPAWPQFPPWMFYVTPLRLATLQGAPTPVLILVFVYALVVAWALAALSFRRASNAGGGEWLASWAIAPVVQIPVILALCLAPPRTSPRDPAAADKRELSEMRWPAVAQGLIAGVGLTLVSVAAGALVFGTYGYGMFVVSPFIIGAMTAYLGNRHQDIGPRETAILVTGATALGGVALLAVALEGIVCLVLAAPLGLGMALVGGMLGRAIALHTRRTPRQTLPGIAVLPLVFAVEAVMAASTSFDTTETIVVDAPPDRVWNAIVNMDPLDEPPPLPFQLGIAYPLRGEIIGEGVGAIRRGEFSTGTAIERITEWIPERKLAFVVVSDVPSMREISLYEHVHAPHASGYFLSTDTSFELVPLAGGHTGIIERTSHQLKLEPVFYWLPMARFVVHENNARVLAHIKRQSEHSLLASAGD